MNRRALLTRPLAAMREDRVSGIERSTRDQKVMRGGLDPYTGTWGREQAAHLLRRCMFGPKATEIETAIQDGLSATVQKLLTAAPAATPPVNYGNQNDPDIAIGQTWVNANNNVGVNASRRNSLFAWWTGQMIHQNVSLTEQMALFWHNHFATELSVYNDARFGYKYLSTLRDNSLGNFKDLVEEMTTDVAMLRYLNGDQNRVGRANENYARELFELFTIGKGPQIGPGNYTNYTEDDVLEAAKVLTGWVITGARHGDTNPIQPTFTASRHDTTTKQFSAAFGNKTISDNGDQEFKDLINMIFEQDETARYIIRKLYRWFVYYNIDSQVETDVILPLAQILIDNNYDIAPVLETLLKSEHFFDVNSYGCLIKNPINFSIGLVRQLEAQFPDPTANVAEAYNLWLLMGQTAAVQLMAPLQPPSVAGWPAYYQTPQYHESWITSATLSFRKDMVGAAASNVIQVRTVKAEIDLLALLQHVSDPNDPNIVIEELGLLFCPMPMDAAQRTCLKAALLFGLPDFTWNNEYNDYLLDPTDQAKKTAVLTKLTSLIYTMLNLPEFHLS
ncbi:MAG: DUF1800 family protein [Bacteroidia bacterium]